MPLCIRRRSLPIVGVDVPDDPFLSIMILKGSLREGAPRSGGGDCGTKSKDALRTRDISRCLRHSLTLVPRELPRGGSLLVSLRRAEKSADGCIAMRRFTPYSSVNLHSASSVRLPPSLAREGFCKSCFLGNRRMCGVDLSKAFSFAFGEGGLPRRFAAGKADEVFANKSYFYSLLNKK